MKYKHIQFSRSTARKNPQMIIDAYVKKINIIEDSIKNFKSKKFKVRLWSYERVLQSIIQKAGIFKNAGYPFEEEIEVNSEDIIKYYKQIEKIHQQELFTLELLNSVKKELTIFRKNYE